MRRLNKRYWPYVVKTTFIQDHADNAFRWCKETMPEKERWIYAGPNNWYFKEEKDKTMFLLKWL